MDIKISKLQKEIIKNRTPNKDPYTIVFPKYKINIDQHLVDMDQGSKLLDDHISKGNHILNVTDLDADGITSGVVFLLSLREVFKYDPTKIHVIVSKRKDGRGFSDKLTDKVINYVNKHNIKLIVTSDHGSRDELQYKKIKEACDNVDIIVTDHHVVEENEYYPRSAQAFINPMRPDDKSNLQGICGCMVLFLLLTEAYKLKNKDIDIFNSFKYIIPYVAVATIVDIMDMSLELNRTIVNYGLRVINSDKIKIWPKLREALGIPGKITARDISFKLGPLINTANRTNIESSAYDLLSLFHYEDNILGYDPDIDELEDRLNVMLLANSYRKISYSKILDNLQYVYDFNKFKYGIAVKAKSNVAVGGSVAGALSQQYKLPSICFIYNDSDKILIGSGRSPYDNVSLLEILSKIDQEDPSIIDHYGGHNLACGVNINGNKYEQFVILFEKHSKPYIEQVDLDKIIVDQELEEKDINLITAKSIQYLEPYGKNFEDPIFKSKLKLTNIRKFGNILTLGFGSIRGVYSGPDTKLVKDLKQNKSDLIGDEYSIYYNLYLDSYNFRYEVKLNIVKIE